MNIIELKDGEVVPGPGAYRMSMDWYHDQCCMGPSISSTGIRQAIDSPHSFWVNSSLNENRYPEKPDSDSLILGKAAHSLFLGDEVFSDHFVFLPENAPPRPTATQIAAFERDGVWSESAAPRAKFWAEWDQISAGKHLLTVDQMEKLTHMAENLARCEEARHALSGDMVEVSLIWEDAATGLWLKSRPDCIPAQRYDFGDLKTFAPKSRNLSYAALRSVLDYDYPVQMAMAIEGAEQIFGKQLYQTCMLIFLQTSAPYEPVPVEIDPEAIAYARVRLRRGIDAIARGLETGHWPFRYESDDIPRFTYPDSMMEEAIS